MEISKQKAINLLSNLKTNTIFNVEYIKRSDKTIRKMSCRLAKTIKKGRRGGVLPYNPKERLLLPVYEIIRDEPNVNHFKMISLDTLKRIALQGQTYEVVGN